MKTFLKDFIISDAIYKTAAIWEKFKNQIDFMMLTETYFEYLWQQNFISQTLLETYTDFKTCCISKQEENTDDKNILGQFNCNDNDLGELTTDERMRMRMKRTWPAKTTRMWWKKKQSWYRPKQSMIFFVCNSSK